MKTPALFLLLLFLSVGVVRAVDPLFEGPGLQIELLSEVEQIKAGESFVVGLHLQHNPGFHTYWKNPGNVGVGTSLKWDLPEGFTASEIQWPHPERRFMLTYPCHGYSRDVSLLVEITPPDQLPEPSVTLSAEATWMCCAKGCFPGHQKFTLQLPVEPKSTKNPKIFRLFEQARSESPEEDDSVQAVLLSKSDADTIELRFSNQEKRETKNAYFFSNDGQISSDQMQEFQTLPDGSLLLKITRSLYSPKGKKTVPGVLQLGQEFFAVEAIPAP